MTYPYYPAQCRCQPMTSHIYNLFGFYLLMNPWGRSKYRFMGRYNHCDWLINADLITPRAQDLSTAPVGDAMHLAPRNSIISSENFSGKLPCSEFQYMPSLDISTGLPPSGNIADRRERKEDRKSGSQLRPHNARRGHLTRGHQNNKSAPRIS